MRRCSGNSAGTPTGRTRTIRAWQSLSRRARSRRHGRRHRAEGPPPGGAGGRGAGPRRWADRDRWREPGSPRRLRGDLPRGGGAPGDARERDATRRDPKAPAEGTGLFRSARGGGGVRRERRLLRPRLGAEPPARQGPGPSRRRPPSQDAGPRRDGTHPRGRLGSEPGGAGHPDESPEGGSPVPRLRRHRVLPGVPRAGDPRAMAREGPLRSVPGSGRVPPLQYPLISLRAEEGVQGVAVLRILEELRVDVPLEVPAPDALESEATVLEHDDAPTAAALDAGPVGDPAHLVDPDLHRHGLTSAGA